MKWPFIRVIGTLGVAVALALTPGVALAHAVVVSSEPEAGQEVGTAPGVVVIRFSEPLNTRLSRALVVDPTGRRFTGGGASRQEIRVPLSTNAPGVYDVEWTTVSAIDGHTLRGSFKFGVGVSPGPGAEGQVGLSPTRSDLALAVARTVEYAALLLAVGMLLVRRLARKPPELDWVDPRLVPVLAVALLGGVATVVGEALAAAPSPSVSSVVGFVTAGLPGLARLSRVGLEALALAAALLGAPSLWLFVAGAIGALATAGHAAAISPAWWGITVDSVHLLGAGLWAGGILALATLRPPDGWRGPAARDLLLRFSPVAISAFLITVAFGVLQGLQELGGVSPLLDSSYGRILLVKSGLVVLMVPLSILAWRKRHALPRAEATVAVLVIVAAALLASYPLPPSRLVEAEERERAGRAATGLPRPGDFTMGDHAGQVLVGFTLRPGRPGPNQVLVYLLPLEGEDAAENLTAQLSVDGSRSGLASCGATCRRTTAELSGNEIVQVTVNGPKGGTATFSLPPLAPPDGASLVERMQQRMHRLRSYRFDETLSSGLATIRSNYAAEEPDRFRSLVNRRAETVWIGTTRYRRDGPDKPWKVERGGPSIPVPSFIWDFFQPFLDPRIIGSADVDDIPTTVVTFSSARQDLAIWFRLWIDPEGLVRRAEMRAIGHFMDHRYHDFDTPIDIEAPTG